MDRSERLGANNSAVYLYWQIGSSSPSLLARSVGPGCKEQKS